MIDEATLKAVLDEGLQLSLFRNRERGYTATFHDSESATKAAGAADTPLEALTRLLADAKGLVE